MKKMSKEFDSNSIMETIPKIRGNELYLFELDSSGNLRITKSFIVKQYVRCCNDK